MSTKYGNGILALLAGAAIGVGLGILFAPDKGTKTREKIKDGLDDLKDEVKTKFKSVENGAKEKFSDSKDALKDTLENLLSDSSYKAEEAISFLEEKLAELKKQNAKLQK
jgi:gas vesicle protein